MLKPLGLATISFLAALLALGLVCSQAQQHQSTEGQSLGNGFSILPLRIEYATAPLLAIWGQADDIASECVPNTVQAYVVINKSAPKAVQFKNAAANEAATRVESGTIKLAYCSENKQWIPLKLVPEAEPEHKPLGARPVK
jgi:hypothetical protein